MAKHRRWQPVPISALSRWERLVERLTGWTRMGIFDASAPHFGTDDTAPHYCAHVGGHSEWWVRYWDHEVKR